MPKGVKEFTPEWKANLSRALTGRKLSAETKAKIGAASAERMRGRKFSAETRRKMSKSHQTNGFKHTEETKKKIRALLPRGENHWNWRGGVTPENERIRHSVEYKEWRIAVFERDNFTCVWCGSRGYRIEADHIQSFALHPELRFDLSNGRTLCKECHKKTDNYAVGWLKKVKT